jgi:pyruvate dehydrogenase E2 component (dihydrolipoamide acetyltransferase)
MESGTISKWNIKNGDSFSAGDSLAVIETDKATIDVSSFWSVVLCRCM